MLFFVHRQVFTAVWACSPTNLYPILSSLLSFSNFEMNTATLQAEGLAGVFKRISKLPPEAVARLFPNIRALRGVIPALAKLEEFEHNIGLMSKRAGATERAYKKMSATLAHSFAQLKQSALVTLGYIGEALAGAVKTTAAKVKLWGERIAEFIKNNR